jgi:trimethylamine--corrinoid protein Co-methyltransferase
MSKLEDIVATAIENTAGAPERRRRAGGGRGGDRGKGRKAPATLRYRSILNTQEPSLLLSEEGLEAIHEASLAVLEQTGMDFMLKEARDRLAAAGADVAAGTERVRLDRGLVEDLVRHAPGPFTLHARNPERSVSIGGRNLAFAQVASAPYCSDKDNGRRTGTQEDYRNLSKTGAILRRHPHDRRLPGGADRPARLGAAP